MTYKLDEQSRKDVIAVAKLCGFRTLSRSSSGEIFYMADEDAIIDLFMSVMKVTKEKANDDLNRKVMQGAAGDV